MKEPLVSIIIPIYNAEEVIKRCLDSVRYQSYKQLEIILVDDGSPDSSGMFCDQIKQQDSRVIVIHKRNGGASAARNAGIQSAKGKYIQFVDSDDYISTDYIYRQVVKMEKNNADILICGYVMIKNNKQDVRVLKEILFEDLVDFKEEFLSLYNEWYINNPWNKMFRKELIQFVFDESISVGEDLLFNLKYLKQCKRILVSDVMGYYYTIEQKLSLARLYDLKRLESEIYLHNCFIEFYKQINLIEKNERVQDKIFIIQIRLYLTNLIRVNNISKSDKIDIINKVIHNTTVINGFEIHGMKKEELFIKYLMKLKNGKLIYMILNFVLKFKRR